MSIWLWLSVVGAVLVLMGITGNFYVYDDEARDAWFGVPHTAHLLLIAAVLAIGLTALSAADRSPMRGRRAGLLMGVAGLLATAQLVYRMVAPPFDFQMGPNQTWTAVFESCLWYCPPAEAADAQLLPAIWMALAGAILVTVAGFAHSATGEARSTEPNFWLAARQTGMTPWLGVAVLGAVGQFIIGYTFFTFYRTPMDPEAGWEGGVRIWSGWLPTPHTGMIVLYITIAVALLVYAAGKHRSPLNPTALGGVIAVLGFVSATRILYRIVEPPFGGGLSPAEVGVAAWLALVAAIVVVIAGIAHAATQRGEGTTSRATQ